jgi:N-acetylglucosaminyldiphosphoundecaprenol N-acetyl-beta-D-mannosaminyltransferase
VHIDGTPILWLARLFGAEVPDKARNAHIDLIPNLLRKCRDNGWPVVIIGSDAEGAEENRRTFSYMFPGISIASFEGYFEIAAEPGHESRREAEILAAIEEFQPKLVLVGMGMPRQEEWIHKIYGRIHSSLIMPVGGFADYFTGRTRMPPRYLGPLGLEWAYRLASDPKRLWFRYIVEPVLLLGSLLEATMAGAPWGKQASLSRRLTAN